MDTVSALSLLHCVAQNRSSLRMHQSLVLLTQALNLGFHRRDGVSRSPELSLYQLELLAGVAFFALQRFTLSGLARPLSSQCLHLILHGKELGGRHRVVGYTLGLRRACRHSLSFSDAVEHGSQTLNFSASHIQFPNQLAVAGCKILHSLLASLQLAQGLLLSVLSGGHCLSQACFQDLQLPRFVLQFILLLVQVHPLLSDLPLLLAKALVCGAGRLPRPLRLSQRGLHLLLQRHLTGLAGCTHLADLLSQLIEL
mmetsp:Transcript_50688/g.115201  ORF Transcript_50688/g.115201 Transcript_50688/m.115201 type:complete len:255 (-) Transcript_50688:557-1321(-)